MTDSEIKRIIESTLSEKRYRHTLGCAETAQSLAKRWGADENSALRAALLHDITKEEPYESQLKLAHEHGIILSDTQKLPRVIHAFTGAIVAKVRFGEDDKICDAIRWHTTARKDMSLLEKIIWISDLTEPGRDFEGVDEIRKLSFSDLGLALIRGFDTTISHLIKCGRAIDGNMIEARNFEILSRN